MTGAISQSYCADDLAMRGNNGPQRNSAMGGVSLWIGLVFKVKQTKRESAGNGSRNLALLSLQEAAALVHPSWVGGGGGAPSSRRLM